MTTPASEQEPLSDPASAVEGAGQRRSEELFRKGRDAEKGGRFEDALQCYLRALNTSPEQHAWHYRHGCVLMKLGRHGDAELAFQRALELAPGTPAYLTNLGVCLDRLGRRQRLLRNLQRPARASCGCLRTPD